MTKPQKHQIFAFACFFHFIQEYCIFSCANVAKQQTAEKFFFEHKTARNEATIVDDDEIFFVCLTSAYAVKTTISTKKI